MTTTPYSVQIALRPLRNPETQQWWVNIQLLSDESSQNRIFEILQVFFLFELSSIAVSISTRAVSTIAADVAVSPAEKVKLGGIEKIWFFDCFNNIKAYLLPFRL